MPTEHLSPAEAAERFRSIGIKVTGRTVHRWVKAGTLRSVTLPSGRVLIPADAVDEFVATDPAAVSA